MSVLLVDIGNSRVKWASLEGGVLGAQQAAEYADWSSADWRERLFGEAAPVRVLAASVAGERGIRALDEAARAVVGRGLERVTTSRTAAGVVNGYADPGQLGVDRWLAVIGAWHRVQGPCVVADVGTAATVEVVAADGRHRGGYIVPGPRLMVGALLERTSDLASFRATSPPGAGSVFADNTRDAIERGCRVALAAWIDRCVRDAGRDLLAPPRLLLSGGAAMEMRAFLDSSFEPVPDLVLRGLAVLADGNA